MRAYSTPSCQFQMWACLPSLFSHVQLFAALWTVACQALLSTGFSRQESWSGLPCPPPGDLLNPGIKPRSPALQADALPSEPPGHPVGSICFNHFPFSSSDSIISAVLFLIAMILSLASSSLPLNPSSDFFHFSYMSPL